MALFFEKIAVAAAALEKQAIRFQSIDENPIRLGTDVDMPRNLAKERDGGVRVGRKKCALGLQWARLSGIMPSRLVH